LQKTNIANKELYSQFLLATQGRYSAVWLSQLLGNHPAHDTFTRWLAQTKLKPHILWEYAKNLIDKNTGYIVIDDTVIDKIYAENIEMAKSQYSGTHHGIVNGIDVVNCLWTNDGLNDEDKHIPFDYRIYALSHDGKTKHIHCREMLMGANAKGFIPQAVLMDCWYADLKTFKLIRSLNWIFISGIESNRKVSLVPHEIQPVAEIATEVGVICHLRDFGMVKVFKIVFANGDIRYFATNNLKLTAPDVRNANARRWRVEEYHRGIKQAAGFEACQARNQRAQRNHIFCSILTFLTLEKWKIETGVSWGLGKQQIIAYAVAQYLKSPYIPFPQKF